MQLLKKNSKLFLFSQVGKEISFQINSSLVSFQLEQFYFIELFAIFIFDLKKREVSMLSLSTLFTNHTIEANNVISALFFVHQHPLIIEKFQKGYLKISFPPTIPFLYTLSPSLKIIMSSN